MGSVVRYRNGWRAYASVGRKRALVGKKRPTKTFRLKAEAEAWCRRVEAEGGSLTFSVAAERFLALKLPTLENAANQRTYENSIREKVLPVIGHMRLADLTRQRLIAVVRDIAAAGTVETAHRVGQRIRAILDHAVDCGDIETHAAAGLSRILPKKKPQHIPAIRPAELPDLLRAIAGYQEPVTRIGLQLLAHTFVRTTELVGARWDEIKAGVWVVPGERMKRGLPHVVPLSPQVQRLLAQLQPMTGESPFWLASRANPRAPISTNTMLFALYRLGYRGRMTGHGFRSVASTILNESGLWSRDAIERQLAHSETDEVRAAYHRAEHLPERTRMLAWYSDHLDALASASAS